MITDQLINGLEKFFKEEKLSDRILRIVEIDEDFGTGQKRKHASVTCKDHAEQVHKKLKRNEEYISSENFAAEPESSSTLVSEQITSPKLHKTPMSLESCSQTPNFQRNIKNEELSDIETSQNCDLTITEVGSTNMKDNTGENEILCCDTFVSSSPFLADTNINTEICFAEFPIHSIVLCINSQFFRKLLVDSGMKETAMQIVSVKVAQGRGKYLEMLVEAFYNKDVLENASLSDLLGILDTAARFSCLNFIKFGLDTLNEKSIGSVQECDTILQHISKIFEVFDHDGKYESIKKTCLKFLSKTFFPLEFKLNEQDTFKSLDYISVMYLLGSNYALTVSENNALVFVYIWLAHNKSCQTADIIEVLLTSIHYESLSPSFLCDHLSISDQILTQWPGYSSWLVNVLKYHALTPAARNLRGIKSSPSLIRSANLITNVLKVEKHFVYDKVNFGFCDRSNNFIVWTGLPLVPVLTLRKHEGVTFVRLKFFFVNVFSQENPQVNFYQKFDIYYSILPGNILFEDSMLDDRRFVQRRVRKGEVQFNCKSTHSFHAIGKVEKDFMPSIERYGLNLILFFKTPICSWNKLETCKSSKKLILLRETQESS